jgi:hypothetical protein
VRAQHAHVSRPDVRHRPLSSCDAAMTESRMRWQQSRRRLDLRKNRHRVRLLPGAPGAPGAPGCVASMPGRNSGELGNLAPGILARVR